MTNVSVSFCSWRMTSKSLSPSLSCSLTFQFASEIYTSTADWPSFYSWWCHLFSSSLTPPSGSPISTPTPAYFPVACSPSLFFIHQTLLHVLTLCCYLRAIRLGNCAQETDFLDLIFPRYVTIRQQHQEDAFRKCWLCVVLCGRQNTLSDPFCKNLVGQIRPRHVES